jgi:hypothetical protein
MRVFSTIGVAEDAGIVMQIAKLVLNRRAGDQEFIDLGKQTS